MKGNLTKVATSPQPKIIAVNLKNIKKEWRYQQISSKKHTALTVSPFPPSCVKKLDEFIDKYRESKIFKNPDKGPKGVPVEFLKREMMMVGIRIQPSRNYLIKSKQIQIFHHKRCKSKTIRKFISAKGESESIY